MTQLALWAGAHCLQTPLGRRVSAPERNMSFLPWRLGTHPLEGKEEQLDSDPTFFPCYQWRN